MVTRARASALVFGGALLGSMRSAGLAATPTDITFRCGSGLQVALEPIIADFERSSGYHVIARWQVINVITDGVMKGEPADLAIVSDQQWQDLSGAGKIDPAVRFVIAKTGYGVFVKKGATKPDVSSVAALKRTLLGASSFGMFDSTSGGPTAVGVRKVLDQLGITADVVGKAKYVPTVYGRVSAPLIFELIANGGAELCIAVIADGLEAPGVDLVGPVPAELQRLITIAYTTAIPLNAKEPTAAKAFIDFLTSPKTASIMKLRGLGT
jgi:molybdate transport system substrate-binding protein